MELLADAAKSHSTQDLLRQLQQLLDLLNVPGPVSKYLPAMNTIPLQHVSVLDLHVEAAAQHAVDLMLGSSVFSNTSNGAAFFTVHLNE